MKISTIFVFQGYHGKGGPLKIDSTNTFPLTDLWLQAGRQMGLNETDPNGEIMEGEVSVLSVLITNRSDLKKMYYHFISFKYTTNA